MRGLKRRADRLEAALPARETPDEEAKRRWLATARVRRNHENHDPDESKARDLFRLFRTQDRLGARTSQDGRAKAR